MEAGIYVEGGRNGVIWIPEGRNGRGWWRFAGELRQLITTKEKGLALEVLKAPSSVGFTWQSFADGIRASSGVKNTQFRQNPNTSMN
jgi:hypothetical protein